MTRCSGRNAGGTAAIALKCYNADGTRTLHTAFGGVGPRCQFAHELKKSRRLANEQPHSRQESQRVRGGALRLGRANDRTYREACAQEWTWLGHDQVGSEVLPAKGRGVEVRKYQPISRVGQRNQITRLVMPCLKMSGLGGADTEQDAQYFNAGYPLGVLRVKAIAVLFTGSTLG